MASRKISDLDSRIQGLVKQLLDKFNSLNGNDGWIAFITDGKRTQAEQNELYAQGRTKPGPIVTWTLKSNHVLGLAVDIAFQKAGKLSYAQTYYDKLVPIAKGLGFDWGGDWKIIKDTPHFEKLIFGSTINTEPIAQPLDIRLSILNENNIKTEGDLREVLGAFKELTTIKEDKLNADKEIDRLRHLIEQDKLDLKSESDANSALKMSYVSHLEQIGKELGNGSDLPGILQQISVLKSDSDKASLFEKQLKLLQSTTADLKAEIAKKDDTNKSYSLKIDSLASELKQFKEILAKWLKTTVVTPESLLGALRGMEIVVEKPLVAKVVEYIQLLIKKLKWQK